MYRQLFAFSIIKLSIYHFIQFVLLDKVLSYNIDTDTVRIFNDPNKLDFRRGSYFGYSVALYASGGEFAVLVGAPRSNSSEIGNVIEPGSVYRCSADNICNEWIIDPSGNGHHLRYQSLNQIKDNAWIGASLAVENKTDPTIVVCGPRWKQSITSGNKLHWFMNGICYSKVLNGLNSFEEDAHNRISPTINIKQQISTSNGVGIFHFGMSQTGFSLHMSSNELRSDLILGSPGIYNWKGSPILISKTLGSNQQTVIPFIGDESRVRSGDYVGYAVTSGHYFRKDEMWFASGAPRSANIHGTVLIFTFPDRSNSRLILKKIVEGEQHGEYFGAALASCDLNNDDRDELIVGAPLWNREVDEGRVYVFSSRFGETFEIQSYEGEVPNGRFGSSVMCLGDIDYDGYADLAVGAPYEENTGAIYIFNGNSNGLGKKYSQKIMGSQYGQGIRGFGISISEPRDINDDHCSDIAVGAYLSEQVILFRSKPVVSITTKLTHLEKKKLSRNSTSLVVELCTVYDGPYAPLSLQIMRLLKVDPMYGRATYNAEKTHDNIYKLPDTLRKADTFCDRLYINLKDNIQNVIDPIEIFVSVILVKTTEAIEEKKGNSFKCKSCAVINKYLSKTEDSIKLPFAVDCGDDDVCISDVSLILSSDLPFNNKYIIGSTSTVKLTVNVSNVGEPAYQAKVNIYMPEILSLASVPPICMEGSRFNGTLEIICSVGNPLRNNKTLMLEIDVSEVRYDIGSIELWANVSTQSEDKNGLNTSQSLTMHFEVDMDVTIAGKAQEGLYSYFEPEKQLDTVRFQHIYEVQKFGASPIEEAVLLVNIPSYWKQTNDDIAIININQTNGYMDGRPFYCDVTNSTVPSTWPQPYKYLSSTSPLRQHTHEQLIIEEDIYSMNLPAENRSLFINCTNESIKCKRLECKLGPFVGSMSVAKLTITLDLQLVSFKAMMEEKDIVYFVSEGTVNITQPYNVTQKPGNKPDHCNISTTFVGSPIAHHVAIWILILSVFLGIILLILLALGLIKLGFFNRKKKEELEALKAESDRSYGTSLEVTSSRQALDEE